MSGERTSNINALTGLVRSNDLGLEAQRPLTTKQVDEVSKWRTRSEDLGATTARAEAARLAKRVLALDEELTANQAQLNQHISETPAAGLLDQTGIGPVTAAVVLAAWSHHGRVRSEGAFACLAGVNPIPASSGNTVRHRLNRGGDRRLNQALHMAVVTRMRMDPATRAYVERRTAEGRTTKEIRRCLIG
jgi:transposase